MSCDVSEATESLENAHGKFRNLRIKINLKLIYRKLIDQLNVYFVYSLLLWCRITINMEISIFNKVQS